jgi:membrane protease subunit HflK
MIEKALADLAVDGIPVGGAVARVINAATTYRSQIVEKVAGEAGAFEQLLPQYEKNPRLVLTKIWEDAREQILTGDGIETFYMVPGQLELQINRDPNLMKERQKEQLSTRKQEQKRFEQNR